MSYWSVRFYFDAAGVRRVIVMKPIEKITPTVIEAANSGRTYASGRYVHKYDTFTEVKAFAA